VLLQKLHAAMAAFKDLSNDANMAKLNAHLGKQSYVSGWNASQDDVAVWHRTPHPVDVAKFPHVARWFTHIASFSKSQQQRWIGAGAAAEKKEEKRQDAKPAANGAEADGGKKGKKEKGGKGKDKQASKPEAKADEAPEADPHMGAEKGAQSRADFEITPEDVETPMADIEKKVRSISKKGLTWLAECEVIPIAFGLSKLHIVGILVDEFCPVEELQEQLKQVTGGTVDLTSHNKL